MDGVRGQPTATLRIICPSCDELLGLDGIEDVQAGDPLSLFCPSCADTIEVTAPKGVEAYTGAGADRVDRRIVSEFPANGRADGR